MNSEVCNAVLSHLNKLQYPEDIIKGSIRTANRIPSSLKVLELLHSTLSDDSLENYTESDELLVYPKIRRLFTDSNPSIDTQFLRLERGSQPTQRSYIPSFLRKKQTILIYQSLGAVTGGTLALKLLHQRLLLLGFESVLCTSKQDDQRCLSPTSKEIVITGEWCLGVLESHGENSSNFRGRGIQYHLGFHHYDDLCRSAFGLRALLLISLSLSPFAQRTRDFDRFTLHRLNSFESYPRRILSWLRNESCSSRGPS
jgi:hypothetical protein